jgi:hypothetical protein
VTDPRAALAAALLETDALTPNDAETLHPDYYIVDAENVGYLVETVLALVGWTPPTTDDEPLAEWECPACGATTRARMADHPATTDAVRCPWHDDHRTAPWSEADCTCRPAPPYRTSLGEALAELDGLRARIEALIEDAERWGGVDNVVYVSDLRRAALAPTETPR